MFCEDEDDIVERMNVQEIKLYKDLTLEIILGNITNDIPENPLCKEKIHQIEIRVALQEKAQDTDGFLIRCVKHCLEVKPIRLGTEKEEYKIYHWKTFDSNKKTRDVRV